MILEDEVYSFAKFAASNTLVEIVLNYPGRKNEIQAFYQRYFAGLLSEEANFNSIDPTFIALSIGDTAEISCDKLLTQIEELFQRGFVDQRIEGDFKVLRKDFFDRSSLKRELKNLEEIYSKVDLSEFHEYKISESAEVFESEDRLQNPAISNKIGRNQACPCASGKKYKKCCGK